MSISENYLNLNNKVVLVTGGYGHLGKFICKDLIIFGAKVYCIGRNKKKFNNNFKDVKKNKNNLFFIKTDVTNEKSVKKNINYIIKKENKIDILINNSIDSSLRTINPDISLKSWNKSLKNVLQGYFLMSKYCIKTMKKKKYGKIINMSSLFSFLAPQPKMYLNLKNEPPVSMAVAKGGINQLTKYLASVLGKYDINVNSVSPGWFPKKSKNSIERKDYIKEIKNRIPLDRIGKPEDIAGVVCFLCSNKSSYITGQNIIVDGGYSIW